MACGVPLVATTGGALPEVVGTDNETALTVPPGDSEALAAEIALALDDPALRARIGAAGRQRVIDRWTWRHTAVGTVEHYRALLAETAAIQARRPGGSGQAPRFQRHRAGRTAMLTVDYDRSACAPATCCSTSAAATAATPTRPSAAAPGSSPATCPRPSWSRSGPCSGP